MRFYCPGDDIYFFGFSRGAYVARFLAEMLDHVGLLSHGNEEMVAFAWKAFSRWQSRQADNSVEGTAKKKEMFKFMKGFRETFSRPVKRIRFLGLFDCVNSVPRFETAWMQRSKFPYTARSTAKVIRHCVSIDERRAKFRQDLIYQGNGKDRRSRSHHRLHDVIDEKYRVRRAAVSGPSQMNGQPRGRQGTLAPPDAQNVFRPRSRSRSRTPRGSIDVASMTSNADFGYDADSDDEGQDIDEIWFAGGHGDVGGGWEYIEGSKSASHVPLTYMIREAEKAGLNFDAEKVAEMGCADSTRDFDTPLEGISKSNLARGVPDIQINASSPNPGTSPELKLETTDWSHFNNHVSHQEKGHGTNPFHQMLHRAHVARIHDSLDYSSGLGWGQVLSWKLMEYMPFRRMDLQPDGSWKPIRWPLPCGEVRDIPHTARIHGSVIRRMQQDEKYRPGNLIVGGGGRGTRRAPKECGIGEWECVLEEGNPVGEVWVKKTPSPMES
ncbi:hypothetical protein JX265_002270 [Neoarthrinium moseri]|uniref:T6SS Phospholipase effector Tle1-like catalytic domain-containing protein n=1 Tax=Neoarthrinium moseri TaxID=1658444 RepID=A0A9P9WUA3_9PEZI|nr:uncharacterized protein JN550_007578 [Neoarthrinium moseri]KAI1850372.1 hypothetical protein JX266_004230 [Neoarthrinium moseri]KAI1866725.1 hypothetical protein JN550_007578 [Neoarthrinium moseri]KAI1879316.1 hypothetical protein JX265_002270 [Neoarthrinium moseri]